MNRVLRLEEMTPASDFHSIKLIFLHPQLGDRSLINVLARAPIGVILASSQLEHPLRIWCNIPVADCAILVQFRSLEFIHFSSLSR